MNDGRFATLAIECGRLTVVSRSCWRQQGYGRNGAAPSQFLLSALPRWLAESRRSPELGSRTQSISMNHGGKYENGAQTVQRPALLGNAVDFMLSKHSPGLCNTNWSEFFLSTLYSFGSVKQMILMQIKLSLCEHLLWDLYFDIFKLKFMKLISLSILYLVNCGIFCRLFSILVILKKENFKMIKMLSK